MTSGKWSEAQSMLIAEHLATRRAQAIEQEHRPRSEAPRRRWRLFVVTAAVVAGLVGVLLVRGGTNSKAVTATTPVTELPWRTYSSPGATFQARLPGVPILGPDEALSVAIPAVWIMVAANPIANQSAAPSALAVLSTRADALGGKLSSLADSVTPLGVGFTAEVVVDRARSVALLKVVIGGSTLYQVEVDGDASLSRTQHIFDQVAQSVAPVPARLAGH
jgi:hypothetical protein